MNRSKKIRAILTAISAVLLSSCGAAPPRTAAPVFTEPPALTAAETKLISKEPALAEDTLSDTAGSGEGDGGAPDTEGQAPAPESDTSEGDPSEGDPSEGDPSEGDPSEETSPEETSSEEISPEETSSEADAETVQEEPAATSAAPETSEAAETLPPETTTAAAPETTAATTTTTAVTTTTAPPETTTTTAPPETTTAEQTKAPAAPSPPVISKVSSPGTSVFTCDSAVIDYSNAASGYISVSYTGVTRLKMLTSCGGVQYDYDILAGSGTQYFTLSQGSGTYSVELYEMADNGRYLKLLTESFAASISDTVKMFTYKNQFVNFDSGSACVAKASEVCAGCTTNLEKIAAVFEFVTDTVTYDRQLAATVTGDYIPDPDTVLAKKTGICFDYASLTAAMLRSQGVPTRLIIGYAYPDIYHAWNEVYTSDKGWLTVEIMLGNSGFNRIDATFYASAADKQSFADYIANSGNYSDVYVY